MLQTNSLRRHRRKLTNVRSSAAAPSPIVIVKIRNLKWDCATFGMPSLFSASMKLPLLYEYVQDWRFHSQRFRAGRGVHQLAAGKRKYQAKEWVIALAIAYAALVSLRHQIWPLLIMALVVLAWRVPSFFAQFGLLNKALFGLRSSFRSHPPRSIRLEISDEGLREFDSGIESFAPWASVRSFRMDRRFVEIELSNGLYAYVPSLKLSPASSRQEDLEAMLKTRGVPKQTPPR